MCVLTTPCEKTIVAATICSLLSPRRLERNLHETVCRQMQTNLLIESLICPIPFHVRWNKTCLYQNYRSANSEKLDVFHDAECLEWDQVSLIFQLNSFTLKALVTTIDALGTLVNVIITAQWEGMGDVGSARYEPALLPPCPNIKVLSYSNCQRSTHSTSLFLSEFT